MVQTKSEKITRTDSHEWFDETGKVGITKYAREEMGEIVYIELPQVGSQVVKGDEVVILESTKAATDITSPLSGRVTAVNESLKEDLAPLNADPEGAGWLYTVN